MTGPMLGDIDVAIEFIPKANGEEQKKLPGADKMPPSRPVATCEISSTITAGPAKKLPVPSKSVPRYQSCRPRHSLGGDGS